MTETVSKTERQRLVAAMILLFTVAYVAFQRQEVRA